MTLRRYKKSRFKNPSIFVMLLCLSGLSSCGKSNSNRSETGEKLTSEAQQEIKSYECDDPKTAVVKFDPSLDCQSRKIFQSDLSVLGQIEFNQQLEHFGHQDTSLIQWVIKRLGVVIPEDKMNFVSIQADLKKALPEIELPEFLPTDILFGNPLRAYRELQNTSQIRNPSHFLDLASRWDGVSYAVSIDGNTLQMKDKSILAISDEYFNLKGLPNYENLSAPSNKIYRVSKVLYNLAQYGQEGAMIVPLLCDENHPNPLQYQCELIQRRGPLQFQVRFLDQAIISCSECDQDEKQHLKEYRDQLKTRLLDQYPAVGFLGRDFHDMTMEETLAKKLTTPFMGPISSQLKQENKKRPRRPEKPLRIGKTIEEYLKQSQIYDMRLMQYYMSHPINRWVDHREEQRRAKLGAFTEAMAEIFTVFQEL
jgi:hypothetical protein